MAVGYSSIKSGSVLRVTSRSKGLGHHDKFEEWPLLHPRAHQGIRRHGGQSGVEL